MVTGGSGYEVAIAGATERLTQEIQCAMLAAMRFPRSEEAARQRIMTLCKRRDFAEKARYKYPRGSGENRTEITGASVVLARNMAQSWGHVRTGFTIISDTEEQRTIEAYAWDMQTNEHMVQQDTFRKVHQRKQEGGKSVWVVPDERDLAELTRNKAGRIIRNCIVHILPWDLVQDALEECKATAVAEVAEDPKGAMRKVIDGFTRIRVPIKEVEQYIGHDLGSCSPAELAHLRDVWTAIQSGEESWRDFYNPEPEKEPVQMDPATASVFQGATGQTVPRPHQDKPAETPQTGPDDATRAFLPPELRQQPGDKRPETEHLLDVIGSGSEDAVNAVFAYLGKAKHLAASDRMALMRACTARAGDFAAATSTAGLPSESASGDVPFAPKETEDNGETFGDGIVQGEATVIQEEPKQEPEKVPDEVIRCFQEMKNRAAAGRMAVEFAYNVRWLKVVEKNPHLEPWTPRVLQERETIIANAGK